MSQWNWFSQKILNRFWIRATTQWMVLLAVAFCLPVAAAQTNVGVSTPLVNVGDSYYERTGVGFSFSMGSANAPSQMFGSFGNNLNFQQGSSNSAIPQFGGYDPAADAVFGFRNQGDNGGFSLGLRMGKGNTRTMSGVAPSIVVPNGGIGSMFSGTISPFVTGVIPVVGADQGAEYYSAPYLAGQAPEQFKSWDYVYGQRDMVEPEPPASSLSDRGNPPSTAQTSDISVAEIKRQNQIDEQAKLSEVDRLIAEATAFEQAEDFSRARLRLRKAVRLTTGQQRYELQLRLESLLDRK